MKKLLSILLTAAMITNMCGCGTAVKKASAGINEEEVQEMEQTVQKSELVRHELAAGASKAGNPLKGFIPFQGAETDFPYSMEWFYLPVSSTQVAMNIFDWTALEEKLNAAAEQGHQAVFRFYYDYPGLETGVPQFLLDGGLTMKPYDEPEALGGGGLCPDYADEAFRQSMKNFIAALGAKYDGDPRIGFITVGLLGFWGEWHNWPFDEDTSDGKPDWSIPTEVYREVLTAFEDAFAVTPLCVREPKAGLDNTGSSAGYHDDSFGYSTLSVEQGGQDWSYGQKLVNFEVADRWKTACIGGEVYPPIQEGLFKTIPEYPDWIDNQGRQDWNACVAEAHPTWLICDRIKLYQDEVRENAEAASKQLGYDFQVKAAYFCDKMDESPLQVRVELSNIGTAPFYYDHNTWPVMLGVKQEGDLVAKWKTEWDLSSIPADGSTVSLEHTIEKHGLGGGSYTLCLKVANPLEGGALLGFANEGQEDDGWLTLGNIEVAAPDKEMTVIKETPPIVYEAPELVPDGVDGVYQAENGRIEGNALIDRDVAECSGGRKVGYIGKEGGSLYIENVEVAAEGEYSLDITYISGEDRSVTITVNDEEDIRVELPASGTGWTTLGTYTVPVKLKAGANTLYFHNETGWAPDMDCIRVY